MPLASDIIWLTIAGLDFVRESWLSVMVGIGLGLVVQQMLGTLACVRKDITSAPFWHIVRSVSAEDESTFQLIACFSSCQGAA